MGMDSAQPCELLPRRTLVTPLVRTQAFFSLEGYKSRLMALGSAVYHLYGYKHLYHFFPVFESQSLTATQCQILQQVAQRRAKPPADHQMVAKQPAIQRARAESNPNLPQNSNLNPNIPRKTCHHPFLGINITENERPLTNGVIRIRLH